MSPLKREVQTGQADQAGRPVCVRGGRVARNRGLDYGGAAWTRVGGVLDGTGQRLAGLRRKSREVCRYSAAAAGCRLSFRRPAVPEAFSVRLAAGGAIEPSR
jgi:hypothetical protein